MYTEQSTVILTGHLVSFSFFWRLVDVVSSACILISCPAFWVPGFFILCSVLSDSELLFVFWTVRWIKQWAIILLDHGTDHTNFLYTDFKQWELSFETWKHSGYTHQTSLVHGTSLSTRYSWPITSYLFPLLIEYICLACDSRYSKTHIYTFVFICRHTTELTPLWQNSWKCRVVCYISIQAWCLGNDILRKWSL